MAAGRGRPQNCGREEGGGGGRGGKFAKKGRVAGATREDRRSCTGSRGRGVGSCRGSRGRKLQRVAGLGAARVQRVAGSRAQCTPPPE